MVRVLPDRATPQYLVTLPSRQRMADYSKVAMPAFYYMRAMRNAGIGTAPHANDEAAFAQALEAHIRQLARGDAALYADNAQRVARMVRKIESRGGRVIFVRFPESGLVRLADEQRFPVASFWKPFLATVGAQGVSSAEDSTLASFGCPDGSHLDQRDQVPFTQALAAALRRQGLSGPHP
jgi:hypothetical protein